jgi:hypothetical protein
MPAAIVAAPRLQTRRAALPAVGAPSELPPL